MRCNELETACNFTTGQRKPKSGRACAGCRHAGHNINIDPCITKRRNFFISASKNHWVAALKANHMLSFLRERNQHAGNFLLPDGRRITAFSDIDSGCLTASKIKNCRRHKIIKKNNVCASQCSHSFKRDQLRIPRPCPYQGHASFGDRCASRDCLFKKALAILVARRTMNIFKGETGKSAPELSSTDKIQSRV